MILVYIDITLLVVLYLGIRQSFRKRLDDSDESSSDAHSFIPIIFHESVESLNLTRVKLINRRGAD